MKVNVQEIKDAREQWQNEVLPKQSSAYGGSGATDAYSAAQAEWAGNYGVIVLTACEEMIEGVQELRNQLQKAGMTPVY